MSKKVRNQKKDFSSLWRILLTFVIQVVLLVVLYLIIPKLKSLKMFTGAMISFASLNILFTMLVFTIIRPKKAIVSPIETNDDSVILSPSFPGVPNMPVEPIRSEKMNLSTSSNEATVFMSSTEFLMPQEGQENLKESIAKGYLVADSGSGQKILIDSSEFVIGRQADEVNYHINVSHISRKHTMITRRNNRFYIKDLESKNKTYLNGYEIAPHQEFELNPGDEIKIFNIAFKFEISIQ